MKTVFAPDSLAALAADLSAYAAANPVAAFVFLTIATAAFAAWAKDSF